MYDRLMDIHPTVTNDLHRQFVETVVTEIDLDVWLERRGTELHRFPEAHPMPEIWRVPLDPASGVVEVGPTKVGITIDELADAVPGKLGELTVRAADLFRAELTTKIEAVRSAAPRGSELFVGCWAPVKSRMWIDDTADEAGDVWLFWLMMSFGIVALPTMATL